MKISLLIISSLFVLGGCSTLPKTQPVEVRTIAEIPPMYHPPLPLEIQGVAVKWKVLTPEIIKEVYGIQSLVLRHPKTDRPIITVDRDRNISL